MVFLINSLVSDRSNRALQPYKMEAQEAPETPRFGDNGAGGPFCMVFTLLRCSPAARADLTEWWEAVVPPSGIMGMDGVVREAGREEVPMQAYHQAPRARLGSQYPFNFVLSGVLGPRIPCSVVF